ncbi:MAG: DUF4831 family protein [Bacteroidales bacterium]|nr:DUF4831 family protein [Bacteroidales bacterium]
MRKISLVTLILFSNLLFAQVVSEKVNSSKSYSEAEGVVYALPKVVLKLDVWIEKTEYVKGPYAFYADRLLGLSNVISKNSVTYNIADISISESYISDLDQLYILNVNNLSSKSANSTFLTMSETGFFSGITDLSINSGDESKTSVVEVVKRGDKSFKYYADANLVDKVDTIIRRVDIDTATIEKAIIKRTSIEKDMSQRAQDAATYYMEIRQNRIELISGFQEVAYTEGAISLMNNELKQLENDYLRLFIGKALISDEHYVFYYTPTNDQPNIIAPIFKFSADQGINYLTSSGGEKVSVAIKSNGLSERLLDADVSSPVNGVVYRFPESAEVWIKYSTKEFDKQLMQIPQLGKLQVLNAHQNTFELYPTSGGVKMMKLKK